MNKKYMVRLSEEERRVCEETAKRLSGGSEKGRRARVLPQADADGPGWSDVTLKKDTRCKRSFPIPRL